MIKDIRTLPNGWSEEKNDEVFGKHNFYTIINDDKVKQKAQDEAHPAPTEDKKPDNDNAVSSKKPPEEQKAKEESSKPAAPAQTSGTTQVSQQSNKIKLPSGTTAELVSLLMVFAKNTDDLDEFEQNFEIEGVDEDYWKELCNKWEKIGVK
jgi:hypothetical protein